MSTVQLAAVITPGDLELRADDLAWARAELLDEAGDVSTRAGRQAVRAFAALALGAQARRTAEAVLRADPEALAAELRRALALDAVRETFAGGERVREAAA